MLCMYCTLVAAVLGEKLEHAFWMEMKTQNKSNTAP